MTIGFLPGGASNGAAARSTATLSNVSGKVSLTVGVDYTISLSGDTQFVVVSSAAAGIYSTLLISGAHNYSFSSNVVLNTPNSTPIAPQCSTIAYDKVQLTVEETGVSVQPILQGASPVGVLPNSNFGLHKSPFAIPATGASPALPAVPPVIYQTATANGHNQSAITVTFGNAFVPGSNVAILVNGGSPAANMIGASLAASGFAEAANLTFCNQWVAGWFGPSANLSGLSFALNGTTDTVNVLAVETNAVAADFTWTCLTGVSSVNRFWTPNAGNLVAASTAVLVQTNENGALSLPSLTAIGTYPGFLSNGTTYHAGIAFQNPTGSAAAVAITAATAVTSPSAASVALAVNLYESLFPNGNSVSGTPVVVGGAAAMPAVIPPPAGGYPDYYKRDLVAVQNGLPPRFQLATFGQSAQNGFQRIADHMLAFGFATARLDFTSYQAMSNVSGDTRYSGRFNAAQGVTGKMLITSWMPWSNTSFIGDVALGNYDSFFQYIADDLIHNGSPNIRLRVTWELNQQYYYNVDEHNCPDQFVNAIRRVVWLMTSRPGAQFVIDGPAPILVCGEDANGDPTQYLTGADATGDLAADAYITAYLDGQGPVQTMTTGRITSLENKFFGAADGSNSGTTSWMKKWAKAYGRPMCYGEMASIGVRNDGYGLGDIQELTSAFCDDILINNPIAYGTWWTDNSGGTDSWITPMGDWPNSSQFPQSWEVLKARLGTPQQDVDVPSNSLPHPPTLSATYNGSALIIATGKTVASDTVVYTLKQVSIAGANDWYTWNDIAPANTIASTSMAANVDAIAALPPTFAAGAQLDIRVCHANTLGLSQWTQMTLDTSTNAQVGNQVHYNSTFGLNSDGTCGPKLAANEIPPTGVVGSTAVTAATSVQKTSANFAANATSVAVNFSGTPNAANHVVIAYIGSRSNLGKITPPAGFTQLASRGPKHTSYYTAAALWFGPATAMTGNGVTMTLTATGYGGTFIMEETTGSFIQFAMQNGAYTRDNFSMYGTMTAGGTGGAQTMVMGWQNAAGAVSTSVGLIDLTGTDASGYSFASLSIPSGTGGKVQVGTAYSSSSPKQPLKPYYLCWITYGAAPPAVSQPTLSAFNTATGVVNPVAYAAAPAAPAVTGNVPTAVSARMVPGDGFIQVNCVGYANGAPITSFTVLRGTASGAESAAPVATVTPTVSPYTGSVGASFNDVGVTNGTTYFYKIIANSAVGNIASGELSATPAQVNTPVHGATNYAKQDMTNVSGNVTLTLPNATTPTSQALFFWGASTPPTMPAGWTKLASAVNTNIQSSVWTAPLSALTSNGITLASAGNGGCYLVEDSSVSFDATTIIDTSVGDPHAYLPPTLDPHKALAARYAIIAIMLDNPDTMTAYNGATMIAATSSTSTVQQTTVLVTLQADFSSIYGGVYSIGTSGYKTMRNAAVIGINGYTS